MGILSDARNDLRSILTNTNEFAVAVTFTPPTGSAVTIQGIHTRHNMGLDMDTGQAVNTPNAHLTVHEKTLTDAGYTVRNANGAVALKGHRVTVADSNGTNRTYTIGETMPDETLGNIVMLLKDYTAS